MNDRQHVGKLIQNLRNIAKLSQEELSDGICSKEELDLYETGAKAIQGDILYKISKRLGVSMNYFFEVGELTPNDYSKEIKETIRYYIRKRNYEMVLHVVNKEKENPMFQDPFHAQFFLWHEAICDYYIHHSFPTALEKLERAISFTRTSEHFYSEKEIAILNSIAIIYEEEGDLKKAFSAYMEALQHITLLPKLKDPFVKIRILYGLSKALCEMERYEKSIKYGRLGLELCVKHETLYLLGELHYQVGESLYKIGKSEEGLSCLQKSIHIFEIEENERFVSLVEQEIQLLQADFK